MNVVTDEGLTNQRLLRPLGSLLVTLCPVDPVPAGGLPGGPALASGVLAGHRASQQGRTFLRCHVEQLLGKPISFESFLISGSLIN